MSHELLIALGSNLGDSQRIIHHAIDCISKIKNLNVTRVSRFEVTKPLGNKKQPDYINAVLLATSSLSPEIILDKLHLIESESGRIRGKQWSSRTLDLDLLMYGDMVINSAKLIVPHPQLHLRSFVLRGIIDVAPDFVHPVLKCTSEKLLNRINGNDFYMTPDSAKLISVSGIIGSGKTTLATALAKEISAQTILEEYDKNPYLAKVYDGQTELAIDSELFFLNSSASQLSKSLFQDNSVYIADYIFEKARVYAQKWLSESDFNKYMTHYNNLSSNIKTPDLVIDIQDSPKGSLSKIKTRNRPYEQDIEIDFLEYLDRSYKQLLTNYDSSPVLEVSTDEFDFFNKADIKRIAEQVKYYIQVDPRENAAG